jgi:hypothetical protein
MMNYVKIVIIVIIIILIFSSYEALILPRMNIVSPIGNLIKYNNVDYAPSGKIEIYLITWPGCPMRAGLSWPLYLVLEKYGNVTVEPHGSLMIGEPGGVFKDILPVDSSIPGLIFMNFTSKDIIFHEIFIYNQELNETTTGYFIRNYTSQFDSKPPIQAVDLGLLTAKQLTPTWVYEIVYKTQVEEKLLPVGNGSVAFAAHHLVSELIITGPKGTWIALFYISPENPEAIVSDSGHSNMNVEQAKNVAQHMLAEINSGNIPSNIIKAANKINNIIMEELG